MQIKSGDEELTLQPRRIFFHNISLLTSIRAFLSGANLPATIQAGGIILRLCLLDLDQTQSAVCMLEDSLLTFG
jgi:hypothetical protein